MNAFWNTILNMVTGFVPSVVSMFKGLDKQGWTPNVGAEHVAEDLGSLGNQNLISNFFRKSTGSSLTEAEREANAFTAGREDIAWERQMEASNTAYQRQVADLQAAGINPMLAVSGGGASSPSMSTAGSVSPSAAAFNLTGFIDVLSKLGLTKANIENVEADTANKAADTAKTVSETKGIDILNNYRAESERLRLEGMGYTNKLNEANIKSVLSGIDKMSQEMRLLSEKAETEVVQRGALKAKQMLDEANVKQIVELLPYEKALKDAQTDNAKQAALLSAANAAYQNGLIDNGYIESVVKLSMQNADKAQIDREVSEVRAMFRTGNIPDQYNSGVNRFVLKNILQPLALVLDNFNPLANILGKAN